MIKSAEKIRARADSLRDRLSLIEKKYQAQLKLHHSKRDHILMKFLLEEQSTYQLALDQLDWVLNTRNDQP